MADSGDPAVTIVSKALWSFYWASPRKYLTGKTLKAFDILFSVGGAATTGLVAGA
jgi:hypothetical protein